ncbi:uncharacterized protein [Miscanthus floridulus]|uniref:uncharacterized protein n=1 Tax=Miscanthus floridulus TaxID=154761 RepID=UPI003457462F
MDNTTILSWNVRGLNVRARRDAVRTLVNDVRPSIVCVGIDVIPQNIVFRMLGVAFTEFAYLPASDTRGGILVAGRQHDVVFMDVPVGCYSITVSIQRANVSGDDTSKWWLTTVYGPQEVGDKILFLEELEAIRDAGQADKNNERIDRANLRRFRRTVATLELQDLHLHGRCFTWSNERENPTLVRLDRVLVSLDWENMFPNAHLRGLGSDASDHCALLPQTNLGQMSKARFHFELFWPNLDDYSDTISQAWSPPVVPLDPLARFDFMLRNLVRQLKSWSAARIGEIRAQLLMARELVLRLGTAQERRQLTEAENALRKRLKMRCLGLSSLERTMARQRSRVRQLSDGDANTAYFHLIARGRKRRN